ncbi:hypothetical protein GQ457_02G015560 [Hibiscus cannabinus]
MQILYFLSQSTQLILTLVVLPFVTRSLNSGPLQACESGLVRGNARPSDVEGYSLVKRRGFRKCITNPWRDTHLGIGVSLPLRRTKLGYRAR